MIISNHPYKIKMKKKLLFILVTFLLLTGNIFAQFDTTSYQAFSGLDYYTNEKDGEIAVFIPESKTGIDIKIDLAFEYEFLNRAYELKGTGISLIPFEMERLHEGNNEITCSFYENEKWVDSRKVNVVKRPDQANEVKIDRASGGLIVNGLPFFPFGFYTESPVWKYLPEEEVVRGFNLISAYQKIERKNLKERTAYMDRCASLGMKVNYNISSLIGNEEIAGDMKAHEQKMKILQNEIEKFRNHPALLSWYISDEPEGQGISAEQLKEAYGLIKELDPYHPVSIVFMDPEKAGTYRNVMDIAMTNPYPIPNKPVTLAADYISTLYRQFRYEKPVWIVPQAFGGNEIWKREPTAREIRVMTYLGLIQHASGVQYFIREALNGSPKSTATWSECGAISLEVADMVPELFSGQQAPEIIPSDQKVQAAAWYHDGVLIILAANTSPDPIPFSLKINGYDLSGEIKVLFENRQTKIFQGNVFDIIDGYGTRAYKIDMRHKTDQSLFISKNNLSIDPGFEDDSSAGIPASCSVKPGQDKGSTFFTDPRISFEGDYSLRLNTPDEGMGAQLSFYSLGLSPEISYSCSVMAKSGSTPNVPAQKGLFGKLFGRSKDKPLIFELSLGQNNKQDFELSDKWELYTLRAADVSGEKSLDGKVSPGLQLLSKGTAWFDLLQVMPDLEVRAYPIQGNKAMQVEIKSVYPGSEIYYTTDGSAPGPSSEKYIGPFVLDKSGTLRAIAYQDGQVLGFFQKKY